MDLVASGKPSTAKALDGTGGSFAQWLVDSKVLVGLLVASFALYLLTKNPLFAALIGLSLVALFVAESVAGAQKSGWEHELREIAVAVITALAIWFGSGFLLGTSAPLDAVVSCSMLPNLDRGDMMVMRGGEAAATEVAVEADKWNAQSLEQEQLVCWLCEREGPGGKYTEPCTGRIENGAFREVDQSGNLIRYECGVCEKRSYSTGEVRQVPCTKAIVVGGQRITENLQNDIIVYSPAPSDVFKGETIHRVYAKVKVDGSIYYLTRGDNNEQLDLQYGNSPIPPERVVGKALFRVPYLGYLKLFLFGFWEEPAGCDSVLLH